MYSNFVDLKDYIKCMYSNFVDIASDKSLSATVPLFHVVYAYCIDTIEYIIALILVLMLCAC